MALGGSHTLGPSTTAFASSSVVNPTSTTVLATPVSSSSDSQSTSNPNYGNFSPSASPPLILAFLAIGIFTVAMIGVIGWRRIQIARGWGIDAATGGRGGSGLGEKPELWDVWTKRTVTTLQPNGGWEQIMPLAVQNLAVQDELEPGSEHFQPATAIDIHTPLPLRFLEHNVQRLFRDLRKPHVAQQKKYPSQTDDPRLQVSVAIAMPSPSERSSVTNQRPINSPAVPEESSPNDIEDMSLEYAIGVVELPCHDLPLRP